MTFSPVRRFAAILLLALSFGGVLGGCGSARVKDEEATRLFREGQYDAAAEKLQAGLTKIGESGSDSLLYLLDLGVAYQQAGRFKDSIKAFANADRVSEIKDYTSLSAEALALLVSDNSKDYKGEEFETVLISTFQAMNYAFEGDLEGAQVEARRVNSKIYRLVNEGQRKYQQSAFANYLSGVLFETGGDYGNAYISYKKAYALRPDFPSIGRDLWRMAYAEKMRDEQERWDDKFNLTAADHEATKRALPKAGQAEIIVIYQNGIGPEKISNPNFRTLPTFVPRANPASYAQVQVLGAGETPLAEGKTAVLDDIEQMAIENLKEKYDGLIAKKIAGMVAKEAAGVAIDEATGNKGWGQLVKLALYVADQADLRSWLLLPKDLQIVRLVVPPGTYRLRCTAVGGKQLPEKTIAVAAGRKVIAGFRYMP